MTAEAVSSAGVTPGVRWKRIVLPPEHGAWGFLFEPIVAALVLVPSIAGGLVAIAALAAFLARNPMRIALADRRLGVRSARTRQAGAVALALGLAAIAPLGAATTIAGPRLLIPLAIALPFALAQQRFEAMRRSRELVAELSGTIAIGSAASVIALAGGASNWIALGLWILLSARAVPAVMYVRSRIALDKRGTPASIAPVAAHLAALAAAMLLLGTPAGNPAAVAVLTLLLARCLVGLSSWRRRVHPRRIGIAELGWGALMVLAVVAGAV